MGRDKYNVLGRAAGPKDAQPPPDDMSLVLESSLVLSGTKYPEPRTRLTFSFVAMSRPGIVRLFFITITRLGPGGTYHGFDASGGCMVVSPSRLAVGKRYEIYGRLGARRPRTLYCIESKAMCYRRLCYEIF